MRTASKPLRREENNIDPDLAESVREGLADAKAGRLTRYEQVRRWLLSWGSDNELPPPECK